jgi:fructose-bisphosphate aldolase class I
MTDLDRSVTAMMARGKGILAADESIATMSSRLAAAGVAPTEASRRDYREMLITTPGLSQGASGVILCDETFRQRLSSGATFPQALAQTGILPGIKVDTGAKPLAGRPGEKVTEGLDGLRERLACYAALGARFAKWRAVIGIANGSPSWQALRANAHALARYAGLCHEAGIVPIVEPEVVMDGGHPMDQCARATMATLLATITELREFSIAVDRVVLKPNMVTPGKSSAELATPDEVARATLTALYTVLPDDLGGVAFLSGGQAPGQAAANLAAIRSLPTPWPVTFSFGRALVEPALAAWRGEPDRIWAGQQALAGRVAACTAALAGQGSQAADVIALASLMPRPRADGSAAETSNGHGAGGKLRLLPVREKLPFLKTSGPGNGVRAWRHAHAEAARQRRDYGR